MNTMAQNSRIDVILSLIDRNHFSLKIDTNPSRDKIEMIKNAIKRKQQLIDRTIDHNRKTADLDNNG